MVREFQTRLKKTNKKETCQQPTGGDLATSKQPTGGERAARLQKEIAENSQKNKSSLYTESDTESDTDNNPLINPPLNQPIAASEKTQKQKSDPRGTRLPDDWQPNAEERAYAEAHGLDPDEVAIEFCDYWLAKAGKDARKVDCGLGHGCDGSERQKNGNSVDVIIKVRSAITNASVKSSIVWVKLYTSTNTQNKQKTSKIILILTKLQTKKPNSVVYLEDNHERINASCS